MSKLPGSPYERAKLIRDACQRTDLAHREEIYKYAQGAAQIAFRFSKDPKAWDDFCKDVFWNDENGRLSRTDISKALLYLLKFTYGDGDNNRKRASHHYRGVQALLDDGVKREDIFKELKARGGWSKVVNDSVEKRKSESGTSKVQAATKSVERPFEKVIKAISKEAGLIAVQINAQQFKKLMKYPVRGSCWLEVKNMGVDDDGYVKFQVIKMDEE